MPCPRFGGRCQEVGYANQERTPRIRLLSRAVANGAKVIRRKTMKRGDRVVGGKKKLIEKLGRDDPCPWRPAALAQNGNCPARFTSNPRTGRDDVAPRLL
jgi:hypothetical protein